MRPLQYIEVSAKERGYERGQDLDGDLPCTRWSLLPQTHVHSDENE